MKTLAIIPSIRDNQNLWKYMSNFAKHNQEVDILKIDEEERHGLSSFGFTNFQNKNSVLLHNFGINERKKWFLDNDLGNPDRIIPLKAHNENSFGLLYALKQKEYDMILFLDDDTYPADPEFDFIGEHWTALNSPHETIGSENKWVNTHPTLFARGYPYSKRSKDRFGNSFEYIIDVEPKISVLNMGFWKGIPDLNAVDYLTMDTKESDTEVLPFTLEVNNWVPICSMNVAFRPEIIPAFYQLWFNDRYDDIFSGLFLEKIAGHLKKNISFGEPFVYHAKVTRNIYDDIRTELSGMELNELLYQILDTIKLTESSWLECYRELALQLRKKTIPERFGEYFKVTTSKMLLWTNLCEKLMK